MPVLPTTGGATSLAQALSAGAPLVEWGFLGASSSGGGRTPFVRSGRRGRAAEARDYQPLELMIDGEEIHQLTTEEKPKVRGNPNTELVM